MALALFPAFRLTAAQGFHIGFEVAAGFKITAFGKVAVAFQDSVFKIAGLIRYSAASFHYDRSSSTYCVTTSVAGP